MIAPEACRSMAELRVQIDALDGRIVEMLALRARYVDRAAQLKPAEGLPARIGPRIEEVVANVRAQAVAADLDPALVEPMWREMIEWAIRREEAAMAVKEDQA